MKNELETLSKSELIQRVLLMEKSVDTQQKQLSQSTTQVHLLNGKLAQAEEQILLFKRLIFGAKRERYVCDSTQLSLPFSPSEAQTEQGKNQHTERIEYTRSKGSARTHPGRVHLPEHLPVEQVVIDPPGDLSAMVCIGQLVTDKLEIVPAKAFIKRYIRNKYVVKGDPGAGVMVADLPDELSDKSIAGASVMAQVVADKYADHLPLYRQQQRFSRHGISIASSTLGSWVATAGDYLGIVYDHYVAHAKSVGYLQVDETPVPVLESEKKGKTHQGYYWVYYSPLTRCVLFDYQRGRGRAGPAGMLEGFSGYLQTDGYSVYEGFGDRPEIIHLGCWAHARRYFERALESDRQRAGYAMGKIQVLYAIERSAREDKLPAVQRKALRAEQSVGILDELGEWISATGPQTEPTSALGKALYYTARHWDKLNVYVNDGSLEIDNNLVENQIRPTVLGRKNFLFAGSHKAAQRAAMFYTMMGNCKLHGVDPVHWLEYVIRNIMSTKYEDVPSLYPQNFKSTM